MVGAYMKESSKKTVSHVNSQIKIKNYKSEI